MIHSVLIFPGSHIGPRDTQGVGASAVSTGMRGTERSGREASKREKRRLIKKLISLVGKPRTIHVSRGVYEACYGGGW